MAPGCAAAYVRWSQPSQDASRANTGSSIFDFEGDGAAEAIYADECFLRVYEGSTGEVLYSAFRTSCTWFENPVVGDPDNDQNTEILVGSNSNCAVVCPTVDPIHRGELLRDGEQCAPPGICDAGFCRCDDDTQCSPATPASRPSPTPRASARTSAAPSTRPASASPASASSATRSTAGPPRARCGTSTPTRSPTSTTTAACPTPWQQNFTTRASTTTARTARATSPPPTCPDITGELDPQTCMGGQGKVILTSTVCNRGKKAVGANLPATFYLGDPADGKSSCASPTPRSRCPIGECRDVSCELDDSVDGTVTVVVDDDGQGGQAALECFENNNTDTILIQDCDPVG
jgi:hypothetical protein